MTDYARDLIDDASRNIAPGPPADVGESLRSGYNLTLNTANAAGEVVAVRNRWGEYLDEVRTITGEEFSNPLDANDPLGDMAGPNAHTRAQARAEKETWDRIKALREKHPNLAVRGPLEIRAEVAKDRARLRSERSEVAARESGLSSVAGFVGEAAGILIDPPVLGSMSFGASVASGVLRGALIDAGINAGVETMQQGFIQGTREQFGEEASLSEAAVNVATAAGGGFLLSGVLRAGGAGLRRLRARSTEADDAAAYLSRYDEMEQATPFNDTPAARAEHVERFDEAMAAQREGRPARLADEPVNPPRRVEAVDIEVPPDVGETVETGLAIGTQMRRAAAELVSDATQTERAALRMAAETARDPDAFAELVGQIRKPPEPRGYRLLTWLARNGGLQEDAGELAALGITPRARPGLVRAGGRSLDDAAEMAFETGYFSERPTINEFLDAIRGDFTGQQPRYRDLEASNVNAEAEQLTQMGDILAGLGADVRRLQPEDARRRVLALGEAIADDPVPGHTAARARMDADQLAGGQQDEALLLNALEADIRRDYAGREDELIPVAMDDGTPRMMSVRQILEEFQEDDALSREFMGCLT